MHSIYDINLPPLCVFLSTCSTISVLYCILQPATGFSIPSDHHCHWSKWQCGKKKISKLIKIWWWLSVKVLRHTAWELLLYTCLGNSKSISRVPLREGIASFISILFLRSSLLYLMWNSEIEVTFDSPTWNLITLIWGFGPLSSVDKRSTYDWDKCPERKL